WNVLKGEMRIVGPRPEIPELVSQYPPEYHRRHDVKPGITGLAQVSGRADLTYEETMLYDLDYVNNHSLARDFAILAKTLPAVITRKARDEARGHHFRAGRPRDGRPSIRRHNRTPRPNHQ